MAAENLAHRTEPGHYIDGLRKPDEVVTLSKTKTAIVCLTSALTGVAIAVAIAVSPQSKGKTYFDLKAEEAAFIKSQNPAQPEYNWLPQ